MVFHTVVRVWSDLRATTRVQIGLKIRRSTHHPMMCFSSEGYLDHYTDAVEDFQRGPSNKSVGKDMFEGNICLLKRISISYIYAKISTWISGCQFWRIYAHQTKILENETAGRACLFEVLCEGVSTRFGLRMLAKSLERHARPAVSFSKIFVWEASLWRTKKSHFRPSDEKSMKNVDKDAVNTTIGLICYLDAWKFVKSAFQKNVHASKITNEAYCCVHRVLIDVFHTLFVRGAKVRLFVRHNAPKSRTHTLAKYLEKTTVCSVFQNLRLGCINCMFSKRRFWKTEQRVVNVFCMVLC